MPTYGYRCPQCSTEFDIVQAMVDPARADCPDCGTTATRLFFPAGILFKGSGFYKTDSRGSSGKPTTAGDTAEPNKAPTLGDKETAGAKGGPAAGPSKPDAAKPGATPPSPAKADAGSASRGAGSDARGAKPVRDVKAP